MHGEPGVAQLRLGPYCAQRQRPVLDVDEVRVALLAVDLEIRQHRLAARAPVDDIVVAIDQLLVIEPDEDFAHGARQPLVHGEAQTRPVAGGAETFELRDDGAARLLLPLPYATNELLTCEVLLLLAFGRQLPLHHHLRCDAGVVGARLPERGEAVHPLHADHHVLQRVVEAVANVERGGHVRRWNDDRVGLLRRRRVGPEVAALFPDRVPPRFDGGGLVAVGDRGRVRLLLAHSEPLL
jgi:hypothetical protein